MTLLNKYFLSWCQLSFTVNTRVKSLNSVTQTIVKTLLINIFWVIAWPDHFQNIYFRSKCHRCSITWKGHHYFLNRNLFTQHRLTLKMYPIYISGDLELCSQKFVRLHFIFKTKCYDLIWRSFFFCWPPADHLPPYGRLQCVIRKLIIPGTKPGNKSYRDRSPGTWRH